MNALTRQLLVISLSLLSAVTVASEKWSFVNPERAFGYTVGDVLEQTIALNDGLSTDTLKDLPPTQREGRWVTRQSVELHPNGQWLTIRYQVVNTPPDVRLISLPALSLVTDQGSSIDVPEWPFSIAALTPELPAGENPLPVMQDDWKPEPPAPDTLWRNIKMLCAALLLTLLLWLSWWVLRGMREASTLPFANANRIIRKNRNASLSDDAPSWLALHRAFDQQSGRSVNGDSIDTLLQSADWLQAFENDIRTFYQMSSARFFANDQSQASFDLGNLSKRLYKAEKRHTSKLDKPSLVANSMP